MRQSVKLIRFFIASLNRRDLSETASCISKDFIFQTPIIKLSGRDKFIKLQSKIDSNFMLIITELESNLAANVLDLQYTYQIHLHAGQKIELKAHSSLYISNQLINKMVVEFKDRKQAEDIFKQMIFH